MKRRSFLAGLIAMPGVARAAIASPEPETSSLHAADGRAIGAGPITEAIANGHLAYSRNYEIFVGLGVGSVVSVKRNGRVVDAKFMERAKFYRKDGALLMSVEGDDVTDTCGAVPLFTFATRK